MEPYAIEEMIRKNAEEMKLDAALDAYGYEVVEYEIFNNVFAEMLKLHPENVKAIIEENLDFFLAEVK